jgi:calcineurin-like phosphoesterase family protein
MEEKLTLVNFGTRILKSNMEVKEKLDISLYNKIYVTSDTHFNHNRDFIFKKRGFENVNEMNNSMINTINTVVQEDDILIHLGDFCLNSTIENFEYFVSNIKVKNLWMLNGNHNNPWSKNIEKFTQRIRFLGDYHSFKIKGHGIYVLFHFPILVWDGQSIGTKLLCGHSHGDLVYSQPGNNINKILDCGWDLYNKPLSLKEIDDIMFTKKIHQQHHDIAGE